MQEENYCDSAANNGEVNDDGDHVETACDEVSV